MSDRTANVLWVVGFVCVALSLARPLRRPGEDESRGRKRWFTYGYVLSVVGFVLVSAAFGHTLNLW